MVLKLGRDYVLTNLGDAKNRINEGVLYGIVDPVAGNSCQQIDPCLFDRLVDHELCDYDFWIDLLVCRSFCDRKLDHEALFGEIAEIYEIFGCPKKMESLVYFLPSDRGHASEETLFNEIKAYCRDAKI